MENSSRREHQSRKNLGGGLRPIRSRGPVEGIYIDALSALTARAAKALPASSFPRCRPTYRQFCKNHAAPKPVADWCFGLPGSADSVAEALLAGASKSKLLRLNAKFGDAFVLRISLDHYTAARHDEERGPHAFRSALEGLVWAAQNGFRTTVAGRTVWGESQDNARAGYTRLFARHAIPIDAKDPAQLVLFPEMHAGTDVPEITTRCWKIMGKSPSDVMCSGSRMVIRRKKLPTDGGRFVYVAPI